MTDSVKICRTRYKIIVNSVIPSVDTTRTVVQFNSSVTNYTDTFEKISLFSRFFERIRVNSDGFVVEWTDSLTLFFIKWYTCG